MKPFNLKEYLKNPSRKVVTRDGRAVKIYCTDYIDKCSIIAKIEGNAYSYSFREDGRFVDHKETNNDLFFDSEKKERWVNLYYDKIRNRVYFGRVFKTKEKAKKAGKSQNNYVITIPIEWEE